MNLITEKSNMKSKGIDKKPILEVLKIMNEEDKLVAYAVEKELPNIAKAVEKIIESFKVEGRLIYIGAGTSGRLGILDASECPPTFSTDKDQVIGIIAGGMKAVTEAIEGAEDNSAAGKEDLEKMGLTKKDVVVGITANGNTPYVLGAMEYANAIGATTVGLSCNQDSKINKITNISITPIVGPEVITGSTRLKAGTAQKMVLNMLSTASMIGIGKVYNNLMVDLNPSNIKLMDRAKRIIIEATGIEEKEAERYLDISKNKPKVAIVMIEAKCSYEEAVERLEKCGGSIYKAIETDDLTK
ncbi:D-lactyl ether N-acetylmuramic-6-phosphate acid etherase [[Clostridium] ultunense Esp]|uniref:N-acetylmuramic acid 6-phosphate etherase n=1 Tax=[Clostridium] ultunense Esp TaxID=1288971 RepID=M1Z785_9FIRM|nr:N-acetylmuramic acid 6-phosphate etherase [Schnuerera ultunensis]CCQ93594.1 D-lactyl ether N-acetylmuramic-6-phosphate acid etherase [[Clostridium] ultunense Esp]SHD77903.1 D-lactyl ether N-acetylmuramic-6-phosphate acid etherase [[Clostridium] ultunense Esp]